MYLNTNTTQYQEIYNSDIFVDKSLLIQYTNDILETSNKCICISRPRRFGKSTDANMLVAYYSKGTDSKFMFDTLKISKEDSYLNHLNKHNVIHLNMQDFLSMTSSIYEMINLIIDEITLDLTQEFSNVLKSNKLPIYLNRIYANTNNGFIFIIDEWDCIFREYKKDKEAQEKYLDFIRNLLKDKPYVEMCYMTGILPIKKYGTHNALNMFTEISMTEPNPLPDFMGFTEKEVEDLCTKYHCSFSKMKEWYDGYHMTNTISTFSPRSVVQAITRNTFSNYWTQTETFEALRIYIDLNFDSLKDDVVKMMSGEEVSINTISFQNDMTSFASKEDVFTLLIHLGYLGYNESTKTCYIPNKEVMDSFMTCIQSSNWNATTKSLQNSRNLLEATWKMDEEK